MGKRVRRHVIEAAVVVAIFLGGVAHYKDFYLTHEPKFLFYQKYFFAAVNIYCGLEPDSRQANHKPLELNERIDLAKISCEEIAASPKVPPPVYYNGWHDTHPILSTLAGHTWRVFGLSWEALWPIAASLAALTIVAFYVILRCFGLPWYLAAALFWKTVPYQIVDRDLPLLRDFSKVPFILLGFGILGLLFRSSVSPRARLAVLLTSVIVVVIGMGFRQDTIVLMPVIFAAAVLSYPYRSVRDGWRVGGEVAGILALFLALHAPLGLLGTGQVAQLQGYPHFLVQGFSDDFWESAGTKLSGISFFISYNDMLAWAAVDANSPAAVGYFAAFDPNYTSSGFDLFARYSGLSLADMVVRVFRGLAQIAHFYWGIETIGTWFLLLLALVALGRWRLGFFLAFTIMSLVAAGSLQFNTRHIIHVLMLDRVLIAIIGVAFARAAWEYATSRLVIDVRLAVYSGFGAVSVIVLAMVAASAVQMANLDKLQSNLEGLNWSPSHEEYRARFPGLTDAILRITVDWQRCPNANVTAEFDFLGKKWPRALDALEGKPRSVYFARYGLKQADVGTAILPPECVSAVAWGPLGDGFITPLQFFDPEEARQKLSLGGRLYDLFSAWF